MEEIDKEIETLFGRQVDFIKTSFKGQEGYVPIIMDFTLRSSISQFIKPTKEESMASFLTYLKENPRNLKDEE